MLIFPVDSFQNRRSVKRCSLYVPLKLTQLRPMLIFIPLGNIRKPHIFDVFREHKKEYWVKQAQYRRDWHNLILLPETLVVPS